MLSSKGMETDERYDQACIGIFAHWVADLHRSIVTSCACQASTVDTQANDRATARDSTIEEERIACFWI